MRGLDWKRWALGALILLSIEGCGGGLVRVKAEALPFHPTLYWDNTPNTGVTMFSVRLDGREVASVSPYGGNCTRSTCSQLIMVDRLGMHKAEVVAVTPLNHSTPAKLEFLVVRFSNSPYIEKIK